MKQFKVSNEIYTDRNRNLDHYFEDVNKKEMLTVQQENELAEKIKTGCEKSKKRLIEANLRFVISVAKSYHRRGSIMSLEDLINEGNLGMIEAANLFDPSYGFKFISFAIWHIRRRIIEAVSSKTRTVRIPTSHVWIQNKIQRIQSSYLNSKDRYPSLEEIKEELDKLDQSRVVSMTVIKTIVANNNNNMVNLEDNRSGELDSYSPIDYIENPDSMVQIEKFEIDQKVKNILKPLNGLERDIISMKLGLAPYTETYTFQQIGDKWGYGAENARIRYRIIIRKLKHKNVLKFIYDER